MPGIHFELFYNGERLSGPEATFYFATNARDLLHLLAAGCGTTRTSRSPLDMSVHGGEAVMPTSHSK
jgi:hypothetical protein